MTRQFAKLGETLVSLICSTNDFGSSGRNRPERSRSARTTLAILAPAGSPMKSGMAIGSGWMLPWLTSTWSAAAAGPPQANANSAAITNFRIGVSWSLSHHLPRVEVERIDFAPLAITVLWQFVGRTGEDRAPRRNRSSSGVGIGRS